MLAELLQDVSETAGFGGQTQHPSECDGRRSERTCGPGRSWRFAWQSGPIETQCLTIRSFYDWPSWRATPQRLIPTRAAVATRSGVQSDCLFLAIGIADEAAIADVSWSFRA